MYAVYKNEKQHDSMKRIVDYENAENLVGNDRNSVQMGSLTFYPYSGGLPFSQE